MDWNFWRPNQVLETRRSKFNGEITVRRSWGLGTYIEVGGLTQSGWILEKIWGQALKEITNHKSQITNVLVLGLGGGSVVKPIRKYWPRAKITGVDIDPVMVKLGQKYLKLDKSVQVIISDASSYMLHATCYDLVIVDLYQGKKFPKQFETDNYIHLLRSNLLRSGVVVINRVWNKRDHGLLIVDFKKKLEKHFKKVEVVYPMANVMFVCKKRSYL